MNTNIETRKNGLRPVKSFRVSYSRIGDNFSPESTTVVKAFDAKGARRIVQNELGNQFRVEEVWEGK